MPEMKSNGLTIHYEEMGSGEPLILIHGMGLNHVMWKHQLRKFSKTYRVIAYTCRGCGDERPRKVFTMSDHVEDLKALLNHISVESAHILGYSMGSYIAQQFAVRYPNYVKSLILTCTKSWGNTGMDGIFTFRATDKLSPIAKLRHIVRSIKRMVGKRAAFYLPLVMFRIRKIPFPTQKIITPQAYAMRNFDVRKDLATVKIPVCIINGDSDNITPLHFGKQTASLIEGSKLVVLKGFGHMIPLECVRKFNKICLNFLSTVVRDQSVTWESECAES